MTATRPPRDDPGRRYRRLFAADAGGTTEALYYYRTLSHSQPAP